MSIPADKLQLILQNILQQSLPLIHKGIFSKSQLKQIMSFREKHERNMGKTTYKVPDYLKAIEYQYELQRKRRHVVATADHKVNPILKKQSKTDFVILKRIIQLWDRTMHKFKYRADLWKQYIAFALAIESKKTFYKALSNAIRFLPFNSDLWKIGVRYEIQVQANLWKARKIYIKAVRMNKSQLEMWLGFAQFEFEFVRKILDRQKIIKGEDLSEKGMKFVMAEQQKQPGNDDVQIDEDQQNSQSQKNQNVMQLSNIDVKNYHNVIWLIIQEALEKCNGSKKQAIFESFQQLLQAQFQMAQRNQQHQIKKIAEQLKKLVINSKNQFFKLNNCQIQQYPNSLLIEDDQDQHTSEKKEADQSNLYEHLKSIKVPNDKVEQLAYYKTWIDCFKFQGVIDWDAISKGLSGFCLKPEYFSQLCCALLQLNFQQTMEVLSQRFQKYTFNGQLVRKILEQLIQMEQNRQQADDQEVNQFNKLSKKFNIFIQTKIKSLNFQQQLIRKKNMSLLKHIVKYNKISGNMKENNNLHRGLTLCCKKHPQVVQMVASLIRKHI